MSNNLVMALFGIGVNAPIQEVESTTPSNYLTAVANLEPVKARPSLVSGSTRPTILHNFTLSRGKVTAVFQLPDYQTESTWTYWEESRVVNGISRTDELQLEFMKFAYSEARVTLSHLGDKWSKTRAVLEARGFDEEYFSSVYKSDVLLNKLFYIIRDAGLADEFRSNSYDLKKFEGRALQVRFSSNGNLMSPQGEEKKTSNKSLPKSDTVVSPADYDATRIEFDLD